MPTLPAEIWQAIFEASLPCVPSYLCILAIVRRTESVNRLRRVSRAWRGLVDAHALFYRFCFGNILPLEDVSPTEARDALDALERWCLKADVLTLALRLSASTGERVHHRLLSLLSHLCPKIVKIHIYCPLPNPQTIGMFTFVALLYWHSYCFCSGYSPSA